MEAQDFLLDIKVKDAVKEDILWVSQETELEKLNELMLLRQAEEVLILDNSKNITGIMTRNDVAKAYARGISIKTPVKDIMVKDVIFIPAEMMLLDARAKMRELGISRAPVKDKNGNILGLITAKTICDAFSNQLERAVGFQKVVLENIDTGICVLDSELNPIFYNKYFEEYFGPISDKESMLKRIFSNESYIHLRGSKNINEEKTWELKSDGKVFSVKIRPFCYGNWLDGLIINCVDITSNLKLHFELDKTAKKLTLLEEKLSTFSGSDFIFGKLKSKNKIMIKAVELAKKVANLSVPVLIIGESGTGKELIASAIHENSERKSAPIVKLNCAAIPPNLFESELFGYEAGAFSGASRQGKPGLLEVADGGTVFLDEIGELPLEMQAKLLRVLQDGTFYKVGGTKPLKVDVRIICATNRPLENLIEKNEFRKDLYYRINVITIEIPPLRERKEDIILLMNSFIEEFEKIYGKKIKRVDPKVIKFFLDYSWPGNVRELKNIVERLVILSEDGIINEEMLPLNIKTKLGFITSSNELSAVNNFDNLDLEKAADLAEKKVIIETLKKFSFNKTKTAKALNISRSTLYNKLKQYNLEC